MDNESVKPDIGRKSVGTVLREARESAGLTLDDAVRVTRIGKAYLVALEGDRYDPLPNEAYIKGFLRVYAAYLKLPEEEIIVAYETHLADKTPCPDNIEPVSDGKQLRKKSSGIAFKRIVPVFVLMILVAAASAYLLNVRSRNDVNVPVSENQNGKNSGTVPGNIIIPEVPAPAPKEAGNPDSAQDEDAKQNGAVIDAGGGNAPILPTGLVLKIKVIEDGWLDVTIDAAVTQHYELKSGDLIEWKGERGFALDISNAGGVQAELNGKTLRPFGKRGESAHVVLNAGDVRD